MGETANMSHAKIKKSFGKIFFFTLSTACSYMANAGDLQCVVLKNNQVCLVPYWDKEEDRAYSLKVNQQLYPRISYYNNAGLKKINNHQFEVITNFSERGNIDIIASMSVVGDKVKLDKLYSNSRVNESPYGAIEYCSVVVNQYFTQDIHIYVEQYLFDGAEKTCIKKKFVV